MYKNEMSVFFCLQASEMLNMDDFLVDESYDGPYLDHDAKITESFIQSKDTGLPALGGWC